MKIFNKGKRRIDHATGSLQPQTAAEFTDEAGAYLLGLFPNELIDMNNVTEQKLALLSDSALHEEIKRTDDEIAQRLTEARAKKAQAAFDAAVAEGFSEEEAAAIAGIPVPVKEPAPAEGEAEKPKPAQKASKKSA